MAAALWAVILLLPCQSERARPFVIEIVDVATGRGVPLVELKTTSGIVFVTDSAGLVALDEPELMNQKVWLEISSHGYQFPPDGFGFAGQAFEVQAGGQARVKINRLNLAERLYRVTGAGIYRDTVLAGRQPPLREPLLNAQVVGSDSVQSALYGGKLHWFWGDTNRLAYALGNFHTPGATSEPPGRGGLDMDQGVDLSYWKDAAGFARPTCQMAGDGPTWLDGLAVLPDQAGREIMFAAYAKVKPPLTIHRRGVCRWRDDQHKFEHLADIPADAPALPFGHPFPYEEGGVHYLYFGDPFPLARIVASAENYPLLTEYESFTCLKPGGRTTDPKLDRVGAGKLRWGWKKNTAPVTVEDELRFLAKQLLTAEETRWRLRDAAGGKAVQIHRGNIAWNDFRKRWIMIGVEKDGASPLGEVWYAEAESPTGPWAAAVKIVTHRRYSFYNPKHHAAFDQARGSIIYFEGTYTHTFAGADHATPRYDYNQIMYRLDLGGEHFLRAIGQPAAAK